MPRLPLPLLPLGPASRAATAARWLRIVVGAGLGVGGVLFALAAGGEPTPVRTDYRVRIADGSDGIVHVRLQIAGQEAASLRLGFSANAVASTAPVSKFRVRHATDSRGRDLSIRRDGGAWVLGRASGTVTVEYEAHLRPQRDSDFAREVLSRLDVEGGRLLGSDVFLFPVGRAIEAVDVVFDLPPGWALHHPFQCGDFEARPPSIRALYNCVMAVGPYRTTRRQVEGLDIVLALQGHYAFGDDDLMDVITDLVAQQVRRFGPPRRSRYVFVVNEHPLRNDPDLLHYFGLHFDGSMIVLVDPRTDRRRLRREPASLCAHEFFHNWLGELVRQEDYDMNWFVEGVTTWYAYQSLMHSRMLDSGSFAEEAQNRYQRIAERFADRERLSVAAAGQRVLQDSQTTELLYSGGLFVAIALDEAIGEATAGESGLDMVLQRLFDRARREPRWVLTRAGLETALQKISGQDFGVWLDRYAYGNGPLDLPEFVTHAR